MAAQYNDDLDYENMDDLPLSDHIEWNYFMGEKIAAGGAEQSNWMDDTDLLNWLDN